MHIQILNFNLKGINHDDFIEIADTMAPVFASYQDCSQKFG